jgi:hypothetical protein
MICLATAGGPVNESLRTIYFTGTGQPSDQSMVPIASRERPFVAAS